MYTPRKGFLLRDIDYTAFMFNIPRFTDIEIIREEEYKSLVDFEYQGTVNSVWIRNADIALDTMDILPLIAV